MESSFLTVDRPGLFRSSAWLRAWLKAWADHPEIYFLEKSALADMNESSLRELELHSRIFKINEPLFSIFPILSAYPFGVSSKRTPSVRSEYFQFGGDQNQNTNVCVDYFNSALVGKWDRLIFPDVLVDSVDYKNIIAAARLQKLSVVKSGHEHTYGVNLKAITFKDYVKTLGKNSRLKLFNSRKRLEQYGQIKIENIWPDRERFFNLLNMFHSLRWGKPCYRDRNEIFINTLLDELPGIGAEVDFSVMTINGVPVSVAFDIFLNGRIYNLQSGYMEDFAKGIALGTLHLGYQMEAAFDNNAADYYDFMAGRGKNSNYKKSLSNSHADFVTVILVRNRMLSLAYKVHARVKKLMYSLAELGIFSVAGVCF